MKLSKVEIFGLDYIIHSPWTSKWKSWDEWSLSVNKGGSGTFHNSLYTDQNNAIL